MQDWDSLIEYKGKERSVLDGVEFCSLLQWWWVEYVHGMDGWMDG